MASQTMVHNQTPAAEAIPLGRLASSSPPAIRASRELLQALALATALFVYTALGMASELPPFVSYIQWTILAALSAWWGWKVWRGEWLARSPLTLPILAILVSVGVSTVFSIDPRVSFTSALGTLVFVALFFVFGDLLLHGWRSEALVKAVLIFTSFAIILGLNTTANWYLGWWNARVPEYPLLPIPFLLSGITIHPNHMPALLNFALPFAMLGLATAHSRPKQALYFGWLLAATAVLFWTGSRGGWVGTVALLGVLFGGLLLAARPANRTELLAWLRANRRLWLATGACLALFLALFVGTALISPSEYSAMGGSTDVLAGRGRIWQIAWEDFLAHPITGSGAATYSHLYFDATAGWPRWRAVNAAHSIYLNTLAEQGLLGAATLGALLAAGLATIVIVWRRILRAPRGKVDPLLIGVPAALTGYLVHGLVDIPDWLAANAVIVLLLGAVGLRAAGLLAPGRQVRAHWLALGLIVPALLVLPLQRQFAAHEAFASGSASALAGDWTAAATALDEAVALDPVFGFYQAQRGYAYGTLADPLGGGDSAAAGVAEASYARALAGGPGYLIDLLNAAWLHLSEGDRVGAEALLENIHALGPDA
ncbi:MAG: O-antigen ligase family protein, partial [Chloroflexota bacterium]